MPKSLIFIFILYAKLNLIENKTEQNRTTKKSKKSPTIMRRNPSVKSTTIPYLHCDFRIYTAFIASIRKNDMLKSRTDDELVQDVFLSSFLHSISWNCLFVEKNSLNGVTFLLTPS